MSPTNGGDSCHICCAENALSLFPGNIGRFRDLQILEGEFLF